VKRKLESRAFLLTYSLILSVFLLDLRKFIENQKNANSILLVSM
jgi:hypothetical protein